MAASWRILVGSGAMGVVGNLVQIAVLMVAYHTWLGYHGTIATDRWLVLVAFANLGALFEAGVAGAALQRIASLSGGARKAWRKGAARFLVFAGAVGGMIAAVVCLVWLRLNSSFDVRHQILIAAAVGSWSTAIIWSTYLAGLLKSEFRFGAAAVVLAAQQMAMFLLPALAPKESVLVSCLIASTGLAVVTAGAAFACRAQPSEGNMPLVPRWRELVGHGAPYAAQNGLAFFFSHVQRLALASFAGPGDVAALGATQSILGKAQGLIGAAGEALNPAVASGVFAPGTVWRVLRWSVALCIAGFAILAILAQVGMPLWLSGSTGNSAARIFPVLAVGYAAASSVAVVVHVLNGMGRPWANAACGFGAAATASLLLIAGHFAGYPPLQVAAAAVGFSYCVYALGIIWCGAAAGCLPAMARRARLPDRTP